jgi:hypothetical protein
MSDPLRASASAPLLERVCAALNAEGQTVAEATVQAAVAKAEKDTKRGDPCADVRTLLTVLDVLTTDHPLGVSSAPAVAPVRPSFWARVTQGGRRGLQRAQDHGQRLRASIRTRWKKSPATRPSVATPTPTSSVGVRLSFVTISTSASVVVWVRPSPSLWIMTTNPVMVVNTPMI